MKKLSLIMAVLMVMSLAAMAYANPFVDVPPGHWAYDALTQVQQSGIIEGFADNTYKGGNNMTRYEVAIIVARILAKVDAKVDALKGATTATPVVDPAVGEKIQKLADEFKPELANLGVKVDGLDKKLAALEGRLSADEAKLAAVEADVAALKENQKVKFYGDAYYRVYAFGTSDNGATTVTRTKANLGMKVSIADNVTLDTQFVALDQLNQNRNNAGNLANSSDDLIIKEKATSIKVTFPKSSLTFGTLPANSFTLLTDISSVTGMKEQFNNEDSAFYGALKGANNVNSLVRGAQFDAKLGSFDTTLFAAKDVFGVGATSFVKYQTVAGAKVTGNFGKDFKVTAVGLLANTKEDLVPDTENSLKVLGGEAETKIGMVELAGGAAYGKLGDTDGDNLAWNINAGIAPSFLKGFKVEGGAWDIDKNFTTLYAYNMGADDDDQQVYFSAGTGLTNKFVVRTNNDPDGINDMLDATWNEVKFPVGQKSALAFRGGVIGQSTADEVGDVFDNLTVEGRAELQTKVNLFKEADFKVGYALMATKDGRDSSTDDSFKINNDRINTELAYGLAKNTTLKFNVDFDNLADDADRDLQTTVKTELKVTF